VGKRFEMEGLEREGLNGLFFVEAYDTFRFTVPPALKLNYVYDNPSNGFLLVFLNLNPLFAQI
jgi:hypothetical protein